MVVSDVIINKSLQIEKCLNRISEDYENDPNNLLNPTRCDAILLNLQRACESAIDLAMHVISEYGETVPQTSREAFTELANYKIISEEMADELRKMTGFRNIAVHQYEKLDLKIVQSIIENKLSQFQEFIDSIKSFELS